MGEADLETLVGEARRLPCFSAVAFEAMELIDSGKGNVGGIATRVSQDQALAGRVLQIANSPFYGLSREIGSIREACVVLGTHMLRSVILAAGLAGCMAEAREGREERRSLWQHSVGTAAIAHLMAEYCGQDKEIAFTAGLLHDIGRTVIELCAPKTAVDIRNYQEAHRSSICEAEQARLGFDHGQLGGRVAEQWRLPVEIQRSIALHHAPLGGETSRLIAIIKLSNSLHWALTADPEADALISGLDADARQCLGLDEQTLAALLPRIKETLHQALTELSGLVQ